MEMKPIALFMTVFIIIILGIVVIQQSASNAELIDRGSDSSSGNILADNGTATTLSPVGVGITSNTATANNDSWLEFDGVNDKIFKTAPSLGVALNGTDITISAWIKIPRDKTNAEWESTLNTSTIFWIRDDSGKLAYQRSSATGNKYLHFRILNATSGSGKSVQYYVNLSDNLWHHVLGTLRGSEGNNVTLYLDGVLVDDSTTSHDNVPQNDTSIALGQDDNVRNFLGGIDEVRLYNQSVTDAQVLEIFNSGRLANSSLLSDNLLLWYSFNEGSGTTVYDKSGNGINGE